MFEQSSVRDHRFASVKVDAAAVGKAPDDLRDPGRRIPRMIARRLPQPVNGDLWKQRFEDIRNFEQYLARNGIVILKFFLPVSKKEQQRRLLARLDDPDKHWKFSVKDAEERRLWQRYQHAYEDMIRHTASKHAPWYVVPADHKWFTRVVGAAAVASALGGLDLHFPRVSAARKKELMKARAELKR